MARFGLFRGGKDDNQDSGSVSHGEDFQCDCTKSGCPCTRWGKWVPAGRPVPNVVVCDQCSSGNHSG